MVDHERFDHRLRDGDDGEVGDVAPEFPIELVEVEFHLHSDMHTAKGVKGVHTMLAHHVIPGILRG